VRLAIAATVDLISALGHNHGIVVDFSALTSCADLTVEQADQAAGSLAAFRAFVARVAEIARPGDGCPKILMAFAKAAAEPWLEGDLRVELSGDEESTTIALIYDHGFGIRERMLPTVKLAAGIDEFERAVQLAPKLVQPLAIEEEEAGRLVLVQRSLSGTEPIRVAQESVVEPIAVNGPAPYNPHTHPTRRMTAIDPEILRAATARHDPRRDED
jgi:hypothetical protein